MEHIDKLQLSKLVSTGVVTGAIATKSNGFYKVAIETPKKAFLLKSQRAEVRLFKTLIGVQKMLNSVGIKSFSVVG